MLDANLKQQLQGYLGRMTQPIEIVATLDGSDAATEMRALLEDVAWRLGHEGSADPGVVASVCMAKNTATRTMQFCADAAVQTLGGMGYMRVTKSERIYREVKVNMIGGGAEEIMKDLAARQLGL